MAIFLRNPGSVWVLVLTSFGAASLQAEETPCNTPLIASLLLPEETETSNPLMLPPSSFPAQSDDSLSFLSPVGEARPQSKSSDPTPPKVSEESCSWDESFLSPFTEQQMAYFDERKTKCEYAFKNEQVQLRHIEGKGIGYGQGYTSIQAFFSPNEHAFVPLLDLRGHVFDDGKFAANAGIGFRHRNTRVYGVHLFYDYRQTHHFHYNQISGGLETLGKWVDFRIDAYFPIGKKQINFSQRKKEEFAFKGANAEVGGHLFKNDDVALYGAIGPYYFSAEGRNAWGGEMRFSATFLDHLRVAVNGSYDPVFRWIGQVQLSLMYFFGPKTSLTPRKGKTISDERVIRDRSSQWIDRSEIIVIDRKR